MVPNTAFALSSSFELLVLSRLSLSVVGAGFVVGIRMVSEWFPPREVGTAEGVLTYTAEASVPPNGAWAIIGKGNPIVPEFPAVWFDVDVFQSQALTIVPAPSAMALLGLGGLVAGRRRR